jgi:branched-chain amino acid transport system permease protein
MGYLLTVLTRFFWATVQGVAGQLSIGMAGIFLLSLSVCFSFSAYSFAILSKNFTFSFWLTFVLSLGLTSLVGFLFSYLYTKVSKDSFTVLALSSILGFDALVKSFDGLTGGVLGISGILRPAFIGKLSSLAVFAGIMCLLVLTMHYFVVKSSLGRKIRAFKEHPVALESLGTSKDSISRFVIVWGAIISSVAGVLELMRLQFLDPSFGGIPNLILFVSIAILALKPKVSSAVLASMFVVFVPEIISFLNFPSQFVGHLRMHILLCFTDFLGETSFGKIYNI